MLSTEVVSTVISSREMVFAPIGMELVFLLAVFQLIREAGLRVPGSIGQAIGIIGGLILGQAAVSANLASSVILIIVALSGLGNFCIPDYATQLSAAYIRMALVIAAWLGGLLGMACLVTVALGAMARLKSYGVPFLAPMAPKTYAKRPAILRGALRRISGQPILQIPYLGRRQLKHMEGGYIGRQETAYLLGIPLYLNGVFTLESQYAYQGGNSTYIWVPLSIVLSLGIFLLLLLAMERAGARDLGELFEAGLGKTLGRGCMALLALLLLLGGLAGMMRFISMLYSYVFTQSVYSSISLWIMGAVFLLAFWGIETLGRLSKLLGGLLLALMLLNLLLPWESYQPYRLYPLPGNTWGQVAGYSLRHTFFLLPALLGGLSLSRSVHGPKFIRSAGCIGGLGAAILAFLTQLAISMIYGYQDLTTIYAPLYRLDMDMLREGYLFRLDKVSLFLWLMGELIGAAFFLFTASRIASRELGLGNAKPAVAAFSVLMGCALFLNIAGDMPWWNRCAVGWCATAGCFCYPACLQDPGGIAGDQGEKGEGSCELVARCWR